METSKSFVLSLSKGRPQDNTEIHIQSMHSFHVYILRCSDGSYYTGHTEDLESRLVAHQRGTMRGYTFSRRPVQLVYSSEFSERTDALEMERRIKGWSRRKKEALIRGDWDELRRLSRGR